MKSLSLASILVAASAALALAGGCMPFRLSASDFVDNGGSGGDSGFGGNAFGGSGGAIITSTATGSGGIPGGGGSGGLAPTTTDLSYLCGGSQATCSPDPGSTDCTPGGNTGMGGAALDAGDSKLTCQIVNDGGAPEARCVLVDGLSGKNGPCTASTDCQPGLGCGQVDATGALCRPYCCGDPDSCPKGTVCQATPMVKASEVLLPLCITVKDCELLNPQSCPAGQTCAVVRADGTRACVDLGSSDRTGDDCPCAQGFMCSPTTSKCIKLCHVGGAADECGLGTCVGGLSLFPDGVGYCVGGP